MGINSRLDTLQAAILIEKLKIFRQEIELRQKLQISIILSYQGYLMSQESIMTLNHLGHNIL